MAVDEIPTRVSFALACISSLSKGAGLAASSRASLHMLPFSSKA